MTEEIEFEVGDTVRYVGEDIEHYYGYRYSRLSTDTPYTVTRVHKTKLEVKGSMATRQWSSDPAVEDPDARVSLLKENFAPFDGPIPRKLGEVPEGGISPLDPGIAWFFEDAAKVASESGHCSEYDQLVDRLGAPGRLRSIKVTVKVGELNLTGTVKAHSRPEAESMVLAQIGNHAGVSG